MQPRELLDVGQELSVQADRVLERNPFLLAQAEVVDAVEGGGVHHACAFLGGDEIRVDDVVGAALVGHRVGIERLVLEPDQVASGYALDDFRRVFEDGQQGLRQDQILVALPDFDVDDVVVDRQGDVPRKRPGGGGPGEDRRGGVLLQAEADVDAWVGHVVAVPLRQLVAG